MKKDNLITDLVEGEIFQYDEAPGHKSHAIQCLADEDITTQKD